MTSSLVGLEGVSSPIRLEHLHERVRSELVELLRHKEGVAMWSLVHGLESGRSMEETVVELRKRTRHLLFESHPNPAEVLIRDRRLESLEPLQRSTLEVMDMTNGRRFIVRFGNP